MSRLYEEVWELWQLISSFGANQGREGDTLYFEQFS